MQRHHRIVRAQDNTWAPPAVWTRPDGVQTGAAGAWLSGGSGPVDVVLEGTVLHADAPADAWTALASWTLSPDGPTATTGLQPVLLGLVRFVRWRISSSPDAAPPGASLSLAIETQD